MKARRLWIVAPYEVTVEAFDLPDVPGPGQVLVETECTLISAGTELAIVMGTHIGFTTGAAWPRYPMALGYTAAGRVVAVGEGVTDLAPGDRVISFTPHASHTVVDAKQTLRIPPRLPGRDSAPRLPRIHPAHWPSPRPPSDRRGHDRPRSGPDRWPGGAAWPARRLSAGPRSGSDRRAPRARPVGRNRPSRPERGRPGDCPSGACRWTAPRDRGRGDGRTHGDQRRASAPRRPRPGAPPWQPPWTSRDRPLLSTCIERVSRSLERTLGSRLRRRRHSARSRSSETVSSRWLWPPRDRSRPRD